MVQRQRGSRHLANAGDILAVLQVQTGVLISEKISSYVRKYIAEERKDDGMEGGRCLVVQRKRGSRHLANAREILAVLQVRFDLFLSLITSPYIAHCMGACIAKSS